MNSVDSTMNFWGNAPAAAAKEAPVELSQGEEISAPGFTEEEDDDFLLDEHDGDDLDGDADASTPANKLFTVEVDGEELQVTEEQLKAAYQKGNASELRFQQAAELQKEAEQHKARYLQNQAMMDEAIQQLNQYISQFQAEAEPNWGELLETAPHEFLKQRTRFEQRHLAAQQAQQAQMLLVQQQQQEQAAELMTFIKQESERLTRDVIPEWRDKEIRRREQTELVKYLEGQGYSQQDIVGFSYSRANNIGIARKAMLYDRAKARAKDARKPQADAVQTPVPTLGDKGKATSKRSLTDKNLTDAEFAKLRREQIANRSKF